MKKINLPNHFQKLIDFFLRISVPSRIIFFIVGIISTLWFLIRVIPKPSRATYPCMKAAAPLASSFITYILGITSFTLLFRKARERLAQSKYIIALGFVTLGLIAGISAIITNNNTTWAFDIQPPQEGNQPIGIAKGIFPGRVVWTYDTDATNENCTNTAGDYWYMNINNDQAVVSDMLSSGIQHLTGTSTDGDAWEAMFRYYNNTHGRDDVGYTSGEKIVIKINMNAIYYGIEGTNTSPHLCYALLDQLINTAGVAQTDISIGDPNCTMTSGTYEKCHASFPDVTYWKAGSNPGAPAATLSDVIFGSDGSFSDPLPQAYIDATYMINVPVFKKHHRSGISLCSKNHFGSIAAYTGGAWHLHPSLPCPDATGEDVPNGNYGVYRCFVDIMGHKDLGGKTILFLVDGLWGSVNWGHPPIKWRMLPFNNDWPNSLFLSQDPVAIESVGYDFLYEEFDENHPTEGSPATDNKGPFSRFPGADDFLHQAADPANWPAGIDYNPENDTSVLTSLGTHEHWNNALDKQYTRNLGTGDGIELVKVFFGPQITPDNSDLLSEKVTSIYVDSFDVKWFGTDMGISRYNGLEWTSITTDNYLLNNNIRDIEYERTEYGHEIWAASEGGLSVLGFDIDGVTAATTYHTGNSDILSNDVLAVGVDIRHNRWVATPEGLNVYSGSDWYDTTSYLSENHSWESLTDLTISAFGSYEEDSMIFVTTDSAGVLRYDFDLIDGFTGASAYGEQWTPFTSNTVNAVKIHDTIQWFGTPDGAYRHDGNSTKEWWTYYPVDSLISPNVAAIELDDEGNLWIGTDKGLSIKTATGWYKYPGCIQASDLTFISGNDQVEISWISGTGVPEGMGLVDPIVNDIKKDFSGNVWVATDGGVEYFTEVPIDYTADFVAKRIAFMKIGSTGTLYPVNGTTYSASTIFGDGTELSGWYCIYNGTGNTVTITGLTPETTYRVIVFEYSGDPGSEIYSNDVGDNNPANFTTGPDDVNDNEDDVEISIYPVPFSDYLIITGETINNGMEVSFYGMDGRLYYKTVLSSRSSRINTSALKEGSYVLQIISENISYNIRVVKK